MKTLTIRVDDSVYEIIKKAAQGQRRSIANFIEFATLQYLTSSEYVSDSEMEEILQDKELVENLKKGLEDVKNKEYVIV